MGQILRLENRKIPEKSYQLISAPITSLFGCCRGGSTMGFSLFRELFPSLSPLPNSFSPYRSLFWKKKKYLQNYLSLKRETGWIFIFPPTPGYPEKWIPPALDVTCSHLLPWLLNTNIYTLLWGLTAIQTWDFILMQKRFTGKRNVWC